ncbi:maleylpyruvate isomerase family mycothiol-dependent enzyme [Kitasatospora camelliae]|uniref:Maleylpyruvate isomerase family mycothiol-dependent enzyme n=1 Tax=Kitasatospora camelliae TaxID=3156397 RepID=A0AAU8K141_9ACTN
MTEAEIAAGYLHAVAGSTDRLLASVARLAPEDVAGPSGLPGWTRGHVLAHLARNADSLVNLLDTARTGVEIPQYASAEAREQGIEDGAGRPLDVQLADVRESHERFAAAAALLPEEAWTVQLRHRKGYLFPAWQLPLKRWQEVEYHHVDLAAGHTPAEWPETFAAGEFATLAEHFRTVDGLPATLLFAEDAGLREQLGSTEGEPVAVEGPVRALTAWLSGRSDGDGLRVHQHGQEFADPRAALPKLPPMG